MFFYSLAKKLAHPLFFYYGNSYFFSKPKRFRVFKFHRSFWQSTGQTNRFLCRFKYYNDRFYNLSVFGKRIIKESFSKPLFFDFSITKLSSLFPHRWLGVVLLFSGFAKSTKEVFFFLRSGFVFVNGKRQFRYRRVLTQGDVVSLQKPISRFSEKVPINPHYFVANAKTSSLLFLGFSGVLFMPGLQFQPFLVPKKNALKSRKRFQQRVNHVKKVFFRNLKFSCFWMFLLKIQKVAQWQRIGFGYRGPPVRIRPFWFFYKKMTIKNYPLARRKAARFGFYSERFALNMRKCFFLDKHLIHFCFPLVSFTLSAHSLESRPFLWISSILRTIRCNRFQNINFRLLKSDFFVKIDSLFNRLYRNKPSSLIAIKGATVSIKRIFARFRRKGKFTDWRFGWVFAFSPLFRSSFDFFAKLLLSRQDKISWQFISSSFFAFQRAQVSQKTLISNKGSLLLRFTENFIIKQFKQAYKICIFDTKKSNFFFSSQLFVEELCFLFLVLKKKRIAKEFLKVFRSWLIFRVQKSFAFGIKGVSVVISGRLPGRGKAGIKKFRVGKTPFQNSKQRLDFWHQSFRSSRGVFHVKVWVLYLFRGLVTFCPYRLMARTLLFHGENASSILAEGILSFCIIT